MYLVAVPVLALCLIQLHSAGKASLRELLCMAGFLGGMLALSASVVFGRFWFRLVPDGKKLQALLRQFESAAAE